MSLVVLQEIRATCNVMRDVFNSLYSHFYMLQVQNLNNIMAFPLENVLKSELRDSRLVSLVFSTYSSNTYKTFAGLTAIHMMMTCLFFFRTERLQYICLEGNIHPQVIFVLSSFYKIV